jgi:hypothetical protein
VNALGIGVGMLLAIVGAMLSLATEATVAGIDIRVVALVLMGSGALGLVLTMTFFTPSRVSSSTMARPVGHTRLMAAAARITDQEVRTHGA